MIKKHRNILALLMTLVLTFVSLPITTKAALPPEEPIVAQYEGYVNGIKRTIVLTSDTFGLNTYLKIGEKDFELISISSISSGPDCYSVIWNMTEAIDTTIIGYWSYDLAPDLDAITFTLYDENVESLIFKGTGTQKIVTGYKTLSGEICSLPSFDTIKFIEGVDPSFPEPFYAFTPDATPIPTKTPELSSPTPIPVTTEPPMLSTPTPVPTTEPTVVPKSVKKALAPRSIKKSKKTTVIKEGGKVVSKTTLNKGKLTWKRLGKKDKQYKGVKNAFLIFKSGNLVYTKKGIIRIVSFKTGKEKRIKGGKKVICSGGAASMIRMISGRPKNIKNM